MTNAGGPGILATDMTVSSDLELAKFKQETIENLASHLPTTANIHNPVDVIGDAPSDRYENALSAVIKDEGVDGALVILTPQSMTNALGTAEAIVRVARRSPKPILCCFMGVVDVSAGVKYLQEHGYPVYTVSRGRGQGHGGALQVRPLAEPRAFRFELQSDRARAAAVIRGCLAAGKTRLGEMDGLELLKCYGFDAADETRKDEEAAAIAEEIGFPVVMKIVSPQILHKSDAGGVVVGLDEGEGGQAGFPGSWKARRAFDPAAVIEGVLVQQMAPRAMR